jgi:hypothetical protein
MLYNFARPGLVAQETHFNPVSEKRNLATNYLRCHAEPVEALFSILVFDDY